MRLTLLRISMGSRRENAIFHNKHPAAFRTKKVRKAKCQVVLA